MGVTVAALKRIQPQFLGSMKVLPVSITFDASYAAAGEALSGQALFRNADIVGVDLIGFNTAGTLYDIKWNSTTKKLQAVRSAAGDLFPYEPGGGDIKGATNYVAEATEGRTDQAAAPVNSALFLAADTFTNFAGTMTPTVQPDVARNLMITILNDSGGALNLYEGVTSFLITGTLYGVAQTETVTLTSTAGNKSVANTKFRYVQSLKAWSTITTVAITNAPAGALKGSLGPGTRLGLPKGLMTPSYLDVTSLTVSAARVAPSATATSAGGVDTTYDTVNVGTIADGADVGIIYKAEGAEIDAAFDLSGVVVKAMIWTYPGGA